jgi:hypothetical protein
MYKTTQLHATPVLGPVPAKATLFAAPVVIHPQLAREDFPACPVLPNFQAVHDLLGQVLGGPSDEQSYVLLDRIVSPSFLAGILKGNQQQMASTLVCGHQLEQEDPFFVVENWISDDGIASSKGVLGFLAGAIYRQEEDPNAIELIAPTEWESSSQRRDIERLLSRGPLLLSHQVLAPTVIEDALMNGFEALCRMHLGFHGGEARAGADFASSGHLLLNVQCGQTRTEFELGAGTISPARMEQLLKRLDAFCANPLRLAADVPRFEDDDEPALVH